MVAKAPYGGADAGRTPRRVGSREVVGGSMFRSRQRHAVRALCVATVAAALGVGVTGNVAGAQSSDTQGVSPKSVTLGFIWSGSGVAAPNFEDSGQACKARVDAQNAKGGVNGRKIDLQAIDDQSGGANLTAAKDLVENRDAFIVIDNSALAFLAQRYLTGAGV